MTLMKFNILIPVAGIGSRFSIDGYKDIKPMIRIGGKTMIERAITSLGIEGQYIFVINTKNKQSDALIKELESIVDNPIIIRIDYLTEGPASTALLAKEFIDNDSPLIITNCDQIMEWDSNNFVDHLTETDKDGIVVTYNISTEKNSYVQLNNDGNAFHFAEKEIISEYSLNGIHFWKKGSYFVNSAESMVKKNIRVNNEFYIAPTYNELISEGKKIGVYHLDINQHWAVGTPNDLEKYLKHANFQT